MKRLISALTILIVILAATSLFASVTVKNMDNMRYDLKLECEELVTPMFVNPNNSFQFNMQGSECNLTLLKSGDRIEVRDNDILMIKNGGLLKN